MADICRLCDIKVDEKCRIRVMDSEDAMKRRFLDLGLIEDTEVKCVGKSPAGDPSAYLIRGAVIAIRNKDCKKILVEKLSEE